MANPSLWRRILGVVIACGLSVVAFADVPKVLITTILEKGKASDTPITLAALSNHLAQELDDEGRVAAVVWGYTDPIFRQAITDGLVRDVPDFPSKNQALETTRLIGAKYTLIFTTAKSNSGLSAHAELFTGGRSVWKNDQNISVRGSEGSFDPESSAHSVARTWVILLAKGPFKELAPQGKVATPDAAPGQAPTTEPPPPTVPPKDESYKTRLADLVKSGDFIGATAMAKDLVDSDPLDPDRRAALVDVLQAAGRYDAAAIAARQAADVMPEHLSLRIRSIRAWIRADKPVDARQDLNEALARDPNSQEVLVLSATIAVATEDPAKAIEESEKAIKGGAGSEAFFIRAIARSMLGGSDGVRLDLTQAFKTEITPGELAERYRFAMRLLGDLSVKAGEDLQTVVQRASIKRTDTEVRRSMELLRNQASARSEFLALFPPPPTRKLSHERWVLVQKLLSQCLAELDQFVKDGSDDTLFDCRINLGEAIKQANAAKAAANAEKTSASSGSNLSP